jgi:hypothetical protein
VAFLFVDRIFDTHKKKLGAVLGFVPDRHSTLEPPCPLFYSVYFGDRVSLFAHAGLYQELPISSFLT